MAVMAFVALALAAPAQQTIIFSKPADLSANKANSFLPGTSHNAGDYNAPHPLFHDYTPDLPMPQPLYRANNDPSAQQELDKRKNWTLLTSEQILGVQTAEEILGVPDRTGEKSLPLDQQFLLRQERSAAIAATNARAGESYWRDVDKQNPFADKNEDDANNSFRHLPPQPESGNRIFNPHLNALMNAQNAAAESRATPNEKANSPWNSAFYQSTPPKPTPDQLADMDRFRAMMAPSTPPDQSGQLTRYSTVAPPVPDPYLQPVPVVNPAGRDITPLDNDLSRPTGITPLPGINTPATKPAATKPSWQAQPPPWMFNGPKAHNPFQNF